MIKKWQVIFSCGTSVVKVNGNIWHQLLRPLYLFQNQLSRWKNVNPCLCFDVALVASQILPYSHQDSRWPGTLHAARSHLQDLLQNDLKPWLSLHTSVDSGSFFWSHTRFVATAASLEALQVLSLAFEGRDWISSISLSSLWQWFIPFTSQKMFHRNISLINFWMWELVLDEMVLDQMQGWSRCHLFPFTSTTNVHRKVSVTVFNVRIGSEPDTKAEAIVANYFHSSLQQMACGKMPIIIFQHQSWFWTRCKWELVLPDKKASWCQAR